MTLAVVGLVTTLVAILTPASVSGSVSPPQASGSTSSSSSQATAADGPSCSTKVLKHEYSWSLDKWSVGMECSGNPTDKTVYVRGVLDVPGAVDTHTAWVKTPGPHQPHLPAQAAPGLKSTNVPVVIGERNPSKDNSHAILAFASLLTNLF